MKENDIPALKKLNEDLLNKLDELPGYAELVAEKETKSEKILAKALKDAGIKPEDIQPLREKRARRKPRKRGKCGLSCTNCITSCTSCVAYVSA